MVQFYGQNVLIEKDYSVCGMQLSVNSNGQVTVKVGYLSTYSDSEIQNFIDKHKRFLHNQLANYSGVQLPDFNDGGKVSLLGNEYTVVRREDIKSFAIEGDILKVPFDFMPWDSEGFFGAMLLPYVEALTELYSQTYGLPFSYVDLHVWHTAWGTHFGVDNSIKYNIALIFVPEECIESVVVHELCHSLYANHSKDFYSEVERIMPDYKEIDRRLKNYNIEWLFERAKLGKGNY